MKLLIADIFRIVKALYLKAEGFHLFHSSPLIRNIIWPFSHPDNRQPGYTGFQTGQLFLYPFLYRRGYLCSF